MPVHDGSPVSCVRCHLPAGEAASPLWSTRAVAPFPRYLEPAPDGVGPPRASARSSVLCLSCHDGALAPDGGNHRTTFAPGPEGTLVPQVAAPQVGAGHPVAVPYVRGFFDEQNGLADPRAPGSTRNNGTPPLVVRRSGPDTIEGQLLVDGRVECMSCHDPHVRGDPDDPEGNYPFLVKSNRRSGLCLTCHNK